MGRHWDCWCDAGCGARWAVQCAIVTMDGAWFVLGAVTAKCAEMGLSGAEWCDVGVNVVWVYGVMLCGVV